MIFSLTSTSYAVSGNIARLGKRIRLTGHSLNSSWKKIKMEIGDFKIDNSNFQKFSGAHFDNRLTFEYHM